jgi:hypothetical protein
MRLAILLMVTLVAVGGCASTTIPIPVPSTAPSTGPASPSPSPAFVPSSGIEDCSSGDTIFTSTARGPKGDPVELVRGWLAGLLPADILTAEPRPSMAVAVTVTRSGAQIGLLHLARDPDGGWLLDAWTLCEGITYT